MLKTLEKHSTKKNILMGIAFIIFINAIGFPIIPAFFFGTPVPLEKMLDLQLGFTSDFSYNILASLQNDGRLNYTLSTLLIDTPYALIYGFIYAFLIIILLKANDLWKYKALAFIPFGIAISDLLENTGIITMLTYFPQKLDLISNLTSFFNQSKWSFSLITLIIVLANLVYYLLIKKQNLRKNNEQP